MPAERHVRIVLQRCLHHGPVQVRDEGEAAPSHFCVLDAQMPRARVIVAPAAVRGFINEPVFAQEPLQNPILESRGERGKILKPICES